MKLRSWQPKHTDDCQSQRQTRDSKPDSSFPMTRMLPLFIWLTLPLHGLPPLSVESWLRGDPLLRSWLVPSLSQSKSQFEIGPPGIRVWSSASQCFDMLSPLIMIDGPSGVDFLTGYAESWFEAFWEICLEFFWKRGQAVLCWYLVEKKVGKCVCTVKCEKWLSQNVEVGK